MGAGRRILADVVDAADAGLGDGDDVVGDVPAEPAEDRAVDLEGAQVAGVDPDDGGAGVDGAAGLVLVVDLDEGGHPERLGVLPQVDEVALVEGRDDEQDDVGAPGAGLGQLVAGDEEVLAQHGDGRPGGGPRRGRRGVPENRRGSVSTLTTVAPPWAYDAASAAGSAMSARAPLLGLDRLTSAMTAMPGCDRSAASASSAGGAAAARRSSSASGTAAIRGARSSRTPATMSSSTLRVTSGTTQGYVPQARSADGVRGRRDRVAAGPARFPSA